jgi:Zn-finger nucleic acid-binding protein
MNCPSCETTELTIAERQGIEIDFCPRCRGVWLDRGELDKLIERTAGWQAPTPRPAPVEAKSRGFGDPDRDRERYAPPPRRSHDDDDDDDYRRHGRRRRGFLDDLFDFD